SGLLVSRLFHFRLHSHLLHTSSHCVRHASPSPKELPNLCWPCSGDTNTTLVGGISFFEFMWTRGRKRGSVSAQVQGLLRYKNGVRKEGMNFKLVVHLANMDGPNSVPTNLSTLSFLFLSYICVSPPDFFYFSVVWSNGSVGSSLIFTQADGEQPCVTKSSPT